MALALRLKGKGAMNRRERASETCLFKGSEAGQWRMHSGGEHWPGLWPGVWRHGQDGGHWAEDDVVSCADSSNNPSIAGQGQTVLPMTSEGFGGEQTGWMWS